MANSKKEVFQNFKLELAAQRNKLQDGELQKGSVSKLQVGVGSTEEQTSRWRTPKRKCFKTSSWSWQHRGTNFKMANSKKEVFQNFKLELAAQRNKLQDGELQKGSVSKLQVGVGSTEE